MSEHLLMVVCKQLMEDYNEICREYNISDRLTLDNYKGRKGTNHEVGVLLDKIADEFGRYYEMLNKV